MSDGQKRLDELREKLRTQNGLLAAEWDAFDYWEKKLDPDAYKKRSDEGARRIALDYARRLSIADLEIILAEKRSTKP